MSNYFKQVPDFEYVSRLPDAKISDYIAVKNLFKKAELRPDIFQDLATFQKHKELWRKTFQDVNMNPLVDTGTEADQFIINIESQYALPNYRGSKSDGEKGLAQGPWIARSKLMQLDFVYAFLHQINTKAKREEFWTDMAFLAMKMGGSKGSFGPFGKLY